MPTSGNTFLIEIWDQVVAYVANQGPKIGLAIFFLLVFYIIGRIFKLSGRREADINLYKRPSPEAIEDYNKVTRRIFYSRLLWLISNITGITIALVLAGVDTLALLQGLGFLGVAFGLAFRDVIVQYYAGFVILTQKPFNIGEQVEIGDVSGVVKQIEMRYTLIRDYHEHDVIIANSKIIANEIHITPVQGFQRDVFRFHIPYDSDAKRAIEVGEEALKNTPGVEHGVEPRGYVRELGVSNLIAFYYTLPGVRREQFNIRNEALQNVWNALRNAGIDMADPIDKVEHS